MDYRYNGKRWTASFGPFPAEALARHKTRRDEVKSLLRRGTDPALVRRAERTRGQTAADTSFAAIDREWLEQMRPRWSARYLGEVERRLERTLFREIGRVPIDEIDAPLLLGAVRRVEAGGTREMPRRLLGSARLIFTYAIATGRATANPALGLGPALKGRPRVKHRASVKPAELPAFMAARRL